MAENPNAIALDIDAERRRLGAHLQELESRIHEATDWRTYARRNPLTMVAGAFGLGLFLSLLFGRR